MKNKKSIRKAKRIKGECKNLQNLYGCGNICKYYNTCIKIGCIIKDFYSPAEVDIRDLREVLKGKEI